MSIYRPWHTSRALQISLALGTIIFFLLAASKWQEEPPPVKTDPSEHDDFRVSTSFTQISEKQPTSLLPILGSVGNQPADSRFHIVISHFNEEPYWIGRWLASIREIQSISKLRPHITIYAKSNQTSLDHIREASTADQVIALPNVGREGGSYLQHILTHWDDLPPYILFTQAQLKKAQQEGSGSSAGQLQDWLVRRLSDQFVGEVFNDRKTGFMSLDRKHDIGYCGHFFDLGSTDEFYPLWPQFFAMILGRPCAAGEPSVVSFNGHFIVSRDRIQSRPKRLYEYLEHLIDAGQDHWIHREEPPRFFRKRFGRSTPSNPLFGHTLERLWHVMFDCTDTHMVEGCDVKDKQEEGTGGCYCMDQVKDAHASK